MELILFIFLIFLIFSIITKSKKNHLKINTIAVKILCALQIVGFWGSFYAGNISLNISFDLISLLYSIFGAIGYCFWTEIAFIITLVEYKKEKNKCKIQELMKQSNLPIEICTDLSRIFSEFNNDHEDEAYYKIENDLILHLKQDNIASNVDTAFKLLVSNNYLTKEQADNYSQTIIKEIMA